MRLGVALLLICLSGCAELDPALCVGDGNTMCTYKSVLDANAGRCRIYKGSEIVAVYSAQHRSGSLYCDPQGWQ